jgi:hypothetical protein
VVVAGSILGSLGSLAVSCISINTDERTDSGTAAPHNKHNLNFTLVICT